MRNINWLGLTIGVICGAASLAISAAYGATMSPEPWRAACYVSIGIAAVLWEMVGYHRSAHLMREGRKLAAALCLFGCTLGTLVTLQYEIGFIAMLFEGNVARSEAASGDRQELEAERADLRAQIQKSGAARGRAVVEAELEGAKAGAEDPTPRATLIKLQADKLAEASAEALRGGCLEKCTTLKKEADAIAGRLAVANDSRARVSLLKAELGLALDNERARARIAEITAKLAPLANAGHVTDARATYLSRAFGISETDARMALAFLLMAFLFAGRAFSGFVFADPTISGATAGAEGAPAAEGPSPSPRAAAEQFEAPAALYAAEMIEAEASAGDDLDVDEIQALWDMEERGALEGMNAGRVERAPAATPLVIYTPDEQRRRGIVARFVADALIVDIGADGYREPARLMQEAFKLWQSDNEIVETVNETVFGEVMAQHLREIGGDKIKSGSWFYVGVRFKPSFAHRMALASGAVDVKPAEPQRRLGQYGQDRRAMIANDEVAGSA